MTITRRQRLRRTGILCLHALRNFAFFQSAQNARLRWAGQQYWVTASNNFLDIGLLEWCKFYGDRRAKHDWRKTVTDQNRFLTEMLNHIRLTEDFFDKYIEEVRTYRDRFIAHLDEDDRMNIPNLAPAIKSTQFLYAWLLCEENDSDAFLDAPTDAVTFFRQYFEEANLIYAAL